MKFTDSNLYITEHGDGYTINIKMPDGSRNYLHTGIYGDLTSAIRDYDYLLKNTYGIEREVIGIVEDSKYYRINVIFKKAEKNIFITFHSRKLNLTDAIYERIQLLVADD